MLARLGEAEPAAVLTGAVSAHFALSLAQIDEDERQPISPSFPASYDVV